MNKEVNFQQIKVEILLATYNGEDYLEELLDSLISQTYQNWVLSISDDGSKDRTTDILNKFSLKYPEKIKSFYSGPGLGPSKNFFELMKNSSEEIIAFCDQDDIWKPKKLEIMIDKFEQLSKKNHEQSIMIFSDATIVDENLNVINDSMFQHNNVLYKGKESFDNLKYTNCITGCCVIANNIAINKAIKAGNILNIKYRSEIVMHDHWLGLITSYNGGILYCLDQSLILYRQHANNAIGAKGNLLKEIFSLKKLKNIIAKYNMLKYFELNHSFKSYFIKHIIHSLKK